MLILMSDIVKHYSIRWYEPLIALGLIGLSHLAIQATKQKREAYLSGELFPAFTFSQGLQLPKRTAGRLEYRHRLIEAYLIFSAGWLLLVFDSVMLLIQCYRS